MFSSKKALAIGQIFIFIIAAITFAVIMIFGYKIINDFLHKGEEVAFAQFKNDLESSVKRIYTEWGAVRVEEFRTPLKYEQICFVDLGYQPDPNEIESLCEKDQAACLAWEDALAADDGYNAVDQNVFLQPPGPVIKVYKISFPQGEGGFLCEDIENGHFSLVLQGMGDKTQISRNGQWKKRNYKSLLTGFIS